MATDFSLTAAVFGTADGEAAFESTELTGEFSLSTALFSSSFASPFASLLFIVSLLLFSVLFVSLLLASLLFGPPLFLNAALPAFVLLLLLFGAALFAFELLLFAGAVELKSFVVLSCESTSWSFNEVWESSSIALKADFFLVAVFAGVFAVELRGLLRFFSVVGDGERLRLFFFSTGDGDRFRLLLLLSVLLSIFD